MLKRMAFGTGAINCFPFPAMIPSPFMSRTARIAPGGMVFHVLNRGARCPERQQSECPENRTRPVFLSLDLD